MSAFKIQSSARAAPAAKGLLQTRSQPRHQTGGGWAKRHVLWQRGSSQCPSPPPRITPRVREVRGRLCSYRSSHFGTAKERKGLANPDGGGHSVRTSGYHSGTWKGRRCRTVFTGEGQNKQTEVGTATAAPRSRLWAWSEGCNDAIVTVLSYIFRALCNRRHSQLH